LGPRMELRDDVVRLRPFRERDLPGIVAFCNDPDTQRFIPSIPTPYDEGDARAYLAFCAECWAEGSRLPFAIADVDTDAYVGSIDVRLGAEGSIGYGVAPWARGRGIATRALRLLADWALSAGGVRRLELTTHADNAASRRVAEKAGFSRVGAVAHDPPLRGDRWETVVYERRRPSPSRD
jgi:RimJ/RimL family protein N-acetyltransferase